MDSGLRWIEEHAPSLVALADTIWGYAEVGLEEVRSAKAQVAFLEQQGFRVRLGVAEMPSALVAEFGHGKPIIGFLGEYDALPGLSQKTVPWEEPLVRGAAGHACGHNLLSVGSVGAAVALRREIEVGRLGGTVRYYGCPAEETMDGKVFMAKHGLFDDVDAAITWQPTWITGPSYASSLAMNSVRIAYHGRPARAAHNPHLGISALDAVELLNVGVNYLREHVIPEARIHYVILNGGSRPNIVPAFAEAWYYLRAPSRDRVDEIYQRFLKIAEGAAQMTGARLEVKFQTGAHEYIPNGVVSDVLAESLDEVGGPKFTPEEWAFAREIEKTFAPGQKAAALQSAHVPPEYWDLTLHEGVTPAFDKGKILSGSSDIGDVSWIVPTGQITVAATVVGSAGHSWQDTATSGMGIGHKGMIVAAKAMSLAGRRLLTDPGLLDKAREAFLQDTKGRPYVSPLPPELTAPSQLA